MKAMVMKAAHFCLTLIPCALLLITASPGSGRAAQGAKRQAAVKKPPHGFIAQIHQDTTSFQDILAQLPASETSYWGDFDNDGDLDLLVVDGPNGIDTTQHSRVFRNDSGSFHDIGVVLRRGEKGAWGDFDGDGDLDIVIAGATGLDNANPAVTIYRNDNGTFVNIGASIPGLAGGTVGWCDFDSDGDLDLLVTGSTNNGGSIFSRLYRNDGGTFTDAGANLPGVWGSSAAWGDFNNDGRPDLALTGYGSGGNKPYVLRNDGPVAGPGWIFTDIGADIFGNVEGTVAWADFDNDGHLDLLVTGVNPDHSTTSKIYRNDGAGHFTATSALLTGAGESGASWGDYDNDGQPDLVIAGSDDFFGTHQATKVYRNDHGTFEDLDASITGTWFGSAAWGDYDNDGDLDLLVAGSTTGTPPYDRVTKIYRNGLGSNSFAGNTLPAAPANLVSHTGPDSVTLGWDPSTDNETPQDGLTYNLRVGATPGGVQIVAPLSDPANGFRKVVQSGNTGHLNGYTLQHLPEGTYYWSVQTVDNAFAGSPFSAEQSFTITGIAPIPEPQIVSVRDVPNDQGGRVTLRWVGSILDTNLNSLPFYSIWRSLPAGPPPPGTAKAAVTPDFHGKAYRTERVNGVSYAWEWIANMPAHRFTTYSFTAPTLFDATPHSDGKHYFLVSAQTTDPNLFYDSAPDSGFSVDNLAPAPPRNLSGSHSSGSFILRWNRNGEPDLGSYLIFRSADPVFDPKVLTPLAETEDTTFVDADPLPGNVSYYVVLARDVHENLSPASNEIATQLTGVKDGDDGVPSEFALAQNYPNPFNPSTVIPFDVARDGFVSIKVYNGLGQEVAVLVNGELAARRYRVTFDAKGLLSGVYYYRMTVVEAGTGRVVLDRTRKLLLLK